MHAISCFQSPRDLTFTKNTAKGQPLSKIHIVYFGLWERFQVVNWKQEKEKVQLKISEMNIKSIQKKPRVEFET